MVDGQLLPYGLNDTLSDKYDKYPTDGACPRA